MTRTTRRPLWGATMLVAMLLGACASVPDAERAATPPYNDAVAARFPAPAVRYQSPAFAPGRTEFTSNAELAAWLARVAASAPPAVTVQRLHLGSSQGGVPIEALRFGGAGIRTALARPVVLLVGQQHGDEPASSEALLVIAQELAGGRLAPLLEQIDVIVLPRANPDGALSGRRVAANGLDINRDHLLLRTPEAQALATLVRDHAPTVIVDAHEHTVVGRYLEKFNAIQRHDMLLQYAMTANLPPALGQASEQWFRQPLLAAMAAEGLTTEWYYTNPTTPGNLRISMGGVQPDTGRNVNGLKNTISILLESRGVGIGWLHFTRRVHSQVVAHRSILHSAARHAQDLVALRERAMAEVAASACRGDAVALAGQTPGRRELLFIDPATGADKPVDVEWHSSLELRPLSVRPRPCGYWLAADAADAVRRLQALGVQVQRLAQPTVLQAEAWRETGRSDGARDDVRGRIADGAALVRVQVALAPAPAFTAPAGSYYVGLDQPLANLVFAALEPDTQNSYFANRVLTRLDQALRVRARP